MRFGITIFTIGHLVLVVYIGRLRTTPMPEFDAYLRARLARLDDVAADRPPSTPFVLDKDAWALLDFVGNSSTGPTVGWPVPKPGECRCVRSAATAPARGIVHVKAGSSPIFRGDGNAYLAAGGAVAASPTV